MNLRNRRIEKNKEQLRRLAQKDGNRFCFDCGTRGPLYVVTNYHILVCSTCSAAHRSFQHKVKGISMSEFTEEEVIGVSVCGNDRAERIWLASFKGERPRPGHDRSIFTFVEDVFQRARYKNATELRALGDDIATELDPNAKPRAPPATTGTTSTIASLAAVPPAQPRAEAPPAPQPVQQQTPLPPPEKKRDVFDDIFSAPAPPPPPPQVQPPPQQWIQPPIQQQSHQWSQATLEQPPPQWGQGNNSSALPPSQLPPQQPPLTSSPSTPAGGGRIRVLGITTGTSSEAPSFASPPALYANQPPAQPPQQQPWSQESALQQSWGQPQQQPPQLQWGQQSQPSQQWSQAHLPRVQQALPQQPWDQQQSWGQPNQSMQQQPQQQQQPWGQNPQAPPQQQPWNQPPLPPPPLQQQQPCGQPPPPPQPFQQYLPYVATNGTPNNGNMQGLNNLQNPQQGTWGSGGPVMQQPAPVQDEGASAFNSKAFASLNPF